MKKGGANNGTQEKNGKKGEQAPLLLELGNGIHMHP
jgi:hypothetical protein